MSEPGGDINWMWWLGIACVLATAQLIYGYFFGEPWVAPADARFADGSADVYIKRFMGRKFSWHTSVWVTDTALHSGALDLPVPFTNIRAIREIKWKRRTEPVIEIECDVNGQNEVVQLAVRDWQKLKALLEDTKRS